MEGYYEEYFLKNSAKMANILGPTKRFFLNDTLEKNDVIPVCENNCYYSFAIYIEGKKIVFNKIKDSVESFAFKSKTYFDYELDFIDTLKMYTEDVIVTKNSKGFYKVIIKFDNFGTLLDSPLHKIEPNIMIGSQDYCVKIPYVDNFISNNIKTMLTDDDVYCTIRVLAHNDITKEEAGIYFTSNQVCLQIKLNCEAERIFPETYLSKIKNEYENKYVEIGFEHDPTDLKSIDEVCHNLREYFPSFCIEYVLIGRNYL